MASSNPVDSNENTGSDTTPIPINADARRDREQEAARLKRLQTAIENGDLIATEDLRDKDPGFFVSLHVGYLHALTHAQTLTNDQQRLILAVLQHQIGYDREYATRSFADKTLPTPSDWARWLGISNNRFWHVRGELVALGVLSAIENYIKLRPWEQWNPSVFTRAARPKRTRWQSQKQQSNRVSPDTLPVPANDSVCVSHDTLPCQPQHATVSAMTQTVSAMTHEEAANPHDSRVDEAPIYSKYVNKINNPTHTHTQAHDTREGGDGAGLDCDVANQADVVTETEQPSQVTPTTTSKHVSASADLAEPYRAARPAKSATSAKSAAKPTVKSDPGALHDLARAQARNPYAPQPLGDDASAFVQQLRSELNLKPSPSGEVRLMNDLLDKHELPLAFLVDELTPFVLSDSSLPKTLNGFRIWVTSTIGAQRYQRWREESTRAAARHAQEQARRNDPTRDFHTQAVNSSILDMTSTERLVQDRIMMTEGRVPPIDEIRARLAGTWPMTPTTTSKSQGV